jgi:hypothetical protein
MTINDRLNELLNANQNKRLAEEKARDERRDNPKILRHTTYQGDRKIQQLGDDIIENGVVLNNQAVEIGDVMLPLAQGNVLRRVDNTNGGELLGSAYRKAKEEDLDINGNQFSGSGVPKIPTGGSGGGGIGNGAGDGKLPTKSSPPSGCQQPPPTCVWSPDPSPPSGWQSYGSVTLDSGTLNLYCLAGTSVQPNLGCDFLDPPQKWACAGGVCLLSSSGVYNSQAECEAARTGGYDVFTIRVESRWDNLINIISDLTYTGIQVPIGTTFSIDSIPSTGGAPSVNTNGMADGVKASPSGLYFDGIELVEGFVIWTFGTITILETTLTDTVPFGCP